MLSQIKRKFGCGCASTSLKWQNCKNSVYVFFITVLSLGAVSGAEVFPVPEILLAGSFALGHLNGIGGFL